MSAQPTNPLTGLPDCPFVQGGAAATAAPPVPSQPAGSPGAPPVTQSAPPGSLPGAPAVSAASAALQALAGAPSSPSASAMAPALPSHPLVPAAWAQWAASAPAQGFPSLAGAISGLATVVASLGSWMDAHLQIAGASCSNCCSCAQGQADRCCDQVEASLLGKLDKIAGLMMSILGEAQGRLVSVTPYPGQLAGAPPVTGGLVSPPVSGPLSQPPPLAAPPPTTLAAQTGSVGTPFPPVADESLSANVPRGTSGPTWYTPYTPPAQPIEGSQTKAGSLPQHPSGQSPIGSPQQWPQYWPQTPGGGPTGGSSQQSSVPTTQPVQIPYPGGPCTIYLSCWSEAMAQSLAVAISAAIVNAATMILTGQPTQPGQPAMFPTSPPNSACEQLDKYESANQWESGPTIYSRPPDRALNPQFCDVQKSVVDDAGEKVL